MSYIPEERIKYISLRANLTYYHNLLPKIHVLLTVNAFRLLLCLFDMHEFA